MNTLHTPININIEGRVDPLLAGLTATTLYVIDGRIGVRPVQGARHRNRRMTRSNFPSELLAGIRASHEGAPALDTVIGHSYGSTMVGAAAVSGHHLDADQVIAVGSPGMLADKASDLNLNSGAHVYASQAQNDIIQFARGTSLGPGPVDDTTMHGSTGLLNMRQIIAGHEPTHHTK